MLDQVLRIFDTRPDFDLNLMQPGQSLPELSARLLIALAGVFDRVKPALTIVQGDTTTTFCGALSSFYAGVPVAHVEAGLRTFDPRNPFPEEKNRVLTADLAALHFPSTSGAAANLRREGVDNRSIEVTGNTGIDAVLAICERLDAGYNPDWIYISIEPRSSSSLPLIAARVSAPNSKKSVAPLLDSRKERMCRSFGPFIATLRSPGPSTPSCARRPMLSS